MKIFLVGLMGSGKSMLGKKVSQSIKLPFIDLDDAIEAQEGMTVFEIFSKKGQEYFRSVEAAALRKQSEAKEFVMATGGGTPCFHRGMEFMNETGVTIFLDTAIPEIVKRLDGPQRNLRPLLKDLPEDELEEKLEAMLQKRLPFYEQAQFTLNGATATAWDVLQLVTKK